MYTYIFFIFLSLIFSLLYFFVNNRNQDYNKVHVLMTIVLLLGLVIEIIGEITSSFRYNNSLLYNVLFVYLETCLFMYFFYLISDDPKVKKRISMLVLFFVLFRSEERRVGKE